MSTSEYFFKYDAVIIIYDFILNTIVVFVVNRNMFYLNTFIKYLKCSNTLFLIDITKLTKGFTKGSIVSQSETHS